MCWTRKKHMVLVSPKRTACAGVGVGMLRGGGLSLNWRSTFHVFKNSKMQIVNILRYLVPNVQTSWNTLKFSAKQVFGLSDPHNYEWKWFWSFAVSSKYLGISKIKNHWFWESWSRSPGPKTMKTMTVRVFPTWIVKMTSPQWFRIHVVIRSF